MLFLWLERLVVVVVVNFYLDRVAHSAQKAGLHRGPVS